MNLFDLLTVPFTPQENVPERGLERVKNDLLSGADCGSVEGQNQCGQEKRARQEIAGIAEIAIADTPSEKFAHDLRASCGIAEIAGIAVAGASDEKFTHELTSAAHVYVNGALTQYPQGTPCFVATNCGLAERRAKPVDKWGWLDVYAAKANLGKGLWLVWLGGDWRGVKPEKIRRIKE